MKKYVVIFITLLIFGLLLMFVPYYMNYNNSKRINETINNYKNNSVDNSYLLKEADEYNKKLTNLDVVDSFIDEYFKAEDDYNKILNLDKDGMMGYIEIPKIGVKLPIYHTTNADVMEKGAGHQPGTSFPVGGNRTHAVIAAHRGLPSSKLFTDLGRMKNGDVFYIHILNKKLAYEVDKIKTVKPTNTKDIKLYKDKDLVTLITCTPYGINTHRLLVRGSRIPLTGDGEKVKRTISLVDTVFYGSIIIALVLFGIFLHLMMKNKPKKSKKKKNNKPKTVNKSKENDKPKKTVENKEKTTKKENKKVEVLKDEKSLKDDEDII